MNIDKLNREHERITELYYIKKSISEDVFQKLHEINTLKISKIKKDFTFLSEKEIDDRIKKMEG